MVGSIPGRGTRTLTRCMAPAPAAAARHRRGLLLLLAAALQLRSAAAFSYGGGGSPSGGIPEFDYTVGGVRGPERWGDLSPAWAACSRRSGGEQSPINVAVVDLARARRYPMRPLSGGLLNQRSSMAGVEGARTDDVAEPAEVLFGARPRLTVAQNHGHPQLSCAAGEECGRLNGRYSLEQFHFHSPSENTINGAHYPLELHMVHAAPDGSLAVVAVLFEATATAAHPALDRLFAQEVLTADAGRLPPLEVDLGALTGLGAGRSSTFWSWVGSLTTPPCTEDVLWVRGGVTAVCGSRLIIRLPPLLRT